MAGAPRTMTTTISARGGPLSRADGGAGPSTMRLLMAGLVPTLTPAGRNGCEANGFFGDGLSFPRGGRIHSSPRQMNDRAVRGGTTQGVSRGNLSVGG